MTEPQYLVFKKVSKDKDIKAVYNYELEAFADYPGFEWSLEKIREDVKKNDWDLYSVMVGDEIVAAAFLKEEKDKLLTKNTPIKMAYQGQGLSHEVKNFFEEQAKKMGLKEIVNFCPDDNFRLISLNESHDYTNEGVIADNENVLKWSKNLK